MGRSETQRFLIDFLAGGLAGIVSKTIAAPIQRVKLLLQTQRQNTRLVVKYKGIIDCSIRCIREEGILSMWRGNGVNVIRYFPTQALNFSFKDFYGRLFKVQDNKKEKKLKFAALMILSGGFAGSTTTLFVHPLDFARTRIAVDLGKQPSQRDFTGLWSCLSKTAKSDGIRGLYRGLIVATVSIFVYRGLYFGLHDLSKEFILTKDTNIFFRLVMAQSSVILAEFISYPGDTVKRKLMMQSLKVEKEYNGAFDCFRKIYNSEGIRGFWRGSYSNIIRGLGSAVCLILFDQIQAFANKRIIN